MDIHGDKWVERIGRQHDRHAGVPDFGYCPERGPRPEVRMVTASMLSGLRRDFSRRNPVQARPVGSIAFNPKLLETEEGRRFMFTGELPADPVAAHDRMGHDGIGCGCLDGLDAEPTEAEARALWGDR